MAKTAEKLLFIGHLCDTGLVADLPDFNRFRQVTSDCRPWKGGGRLGVCGTCGTVQKSSRRRMEDRRRLKTGNCQIESELLTLKQC